MILLPTEEDSWRRVLLLGRAGAYWAEIAVARKHAGRRWDKSGERRTEKKKERKCKGRGSASQGDKESVFGMM